MDYEQKYKEALTNARQEYNTTENVERKQWLEELFPELKESKDERVRNQIINFIEEHGNPIHCEWQKDWIAWLEKQSTPQVRTGLEWVNTIDDACDKRYAEEYAHGEYCHEQSFKWGFQEGVEWLEQQGEPTDINPSEFDLRLNKLLKQFETLPKEELANSLSFYLNVVQNDGTYREEKQGEQKPTEWSEEDENNLYLTTVAIEREYSGELFLNPKKVNEQVGIGRKLINWLRSFENRVGCEVNCTTTKEWSEEDKKKLNRIYMLLAEAADEHAFSTTCRLIGDNECVELQDFLKSLKPQNHWKPTEEQMEALNYVVNLMASSESPKENDYYYNVFKDLKKQIRNL